MLKLAGGEMEHTGRADKKKKMKKKKKIPIYVCVCHSDELAPVSLALPEQTGRRMTDVVGRAALMFGADVTPPTDDPSTPDRWKRTFLEVTE